jgi:uncharacterized DUF497 family protein
LNSLLFLYHQVLDKKIGLIQNVVRAKRPSRLPVVLTKEEVQRLLNSITGTPCSMAMLLYGAGLRLMECCRLRVKDKLASNTAPYSQSCGELALYVSLTEGDGVLSDPLAVTIEDESAEGEQRFVTLGENTFGALMLVVWTPRDEDVRIISVRKPTPRERRSYEKGV